MSSAYHPWTKEVLFDLQRLWKQSNNNIQYVQAHLLGPPRTIGAIGKMLSIQSLKSRSSYTISRRKRSRHGLKNRTGRFVKSNESTLKEMDKFSLITGLEVGIPSTQIRGVAFSSVLNDALPHLYNAVLPIGMTPSGQNCKLALSESPCRDIATRMIPRLTRSAKKNHLAEWEEWKEPNPMTVNEFLQNSNQSMIIDCPKVATLHCLNGTQQLDLSRPTDAENNKPGVADRLSQNPKGQSQTDVQQTKYASKAGTSSFNDKPCTESAGTTNTRRALQLEVVDACSKNEIQSRSPIIASQVMTRYRLLLKTNNNDQLPYRISVLFLLAKPPKKGGLATPHHSKRVYSNDQLTTVIPITNSGMEYLSISFSVQVPLDTQEIVKYDIIPWLQDTLLLPNMYIFSIT